MNSIPKIDITDEMVDRAYAWWEGNSLAHRAGMRAMLTAALTEPTRPEGATYWDGVIADQRRTDMDAFETAARAEAPPVCEHYWISHSQDSVLIPWVIRCGSCGAFNTAEMDHLALDYLASQEPSDAGPHELNEDAPIRNLGYYRSSTRCTCGYEVIWGEHDGDAGLDEAWRVHLMRSAVHAFRAARAVRRDAR